MKKIIICVILIFFTNSLGFSQSFTGTKTTNGTTRTITTTALSILPEGDSITSGGTDGQIDWSYRKALQQNLKNFYTLTFIGTYTNPASDAYYSGITDGHQGDTINTIRVRLATTKSSLSSSVSYGRQAVVINAGTNDINLGTNPNTVIPYIVGGSSPLGMVEDLYAYNTTIETYVMLMTPSTDAFSSAHVTFNTALLSALQTSQSTHPRLHIIDMYSAFNSLCPSLAACLLSDGFHPSAVGMHIMGNMVANCINSSTATYCDGH